MPSIQRYYKAALLSILLVQVVSSAATASSITTSPPVVDLSFLHNLPASSLKKAVEDHAKGQDHVTINLSHLSLDDTAVQEILTDMLNTGLSSAHVDLSMNRITPVGVNWLCNALLKGQPEEGNGATESLNKRRLESLDLSCNYLALDVGDTTHFHATVEKLIAHHNKCPTELCLDQCSLGPVFCRSLGKGLIHRHIQDEEEKTPMATNTIPSLSLSLSGNPEIGDAGTAAIAAALRTIATSETEESSASKNVLERLDLSACGIGNAGAEALALAIEDGCGARILDLSNNQLQDEGVAALGRAIALADGDTVRVLDLSNNEVGVAGCTALMVAIGKGRLQEVRLRSCHIHADGAEIIGKGLRSIILQKTVPALDVDLSGNPLGVLRGKNKKGGGKYSASRLKSTATATAASYMNLLKKGLKDVGMDSMLGGQSAESDDEEEKLPGEDNSGEDDDSSSEFAKKRCGAKAMANVFLKDLEETSSKLAPIPISCRVRLGLRHCFLDHEAADALAAMLVGSKDRYGGDINTDVAMNPVLEEEMVNALHGEGPDDDRLREMAERYMDVLDALKEAQERAAEARAMARASRDEERNSFYEAEEDSGYAISDYDDDDVDAFGFVEDDSDEDSY
eukprot:scaffold1314_cov158-Amphora_coffeaeformis.AAC.15